MTLVLALSAALLASEAVPEAVVHAVEQVESSGRGTKTPIGDGGKALGCLQWHSVAWSDCSAIRLNAGLAVYPYAAAAVPAKAREYARTWLTVLKVRLAARIGRQPFPGEIWLAWNLGWTGFQRYGFSWAYVPRVKFDKARQVNSLAWGLPKRPAVAR
tara:strand:+ start:1295 stop:1768 length:474 start_codon:yes stop_codon:yes gene_type:complete